MKTVHGFENYQIKEDGQVFSRYKNKLMKGSLDKDGYKFYCLTVRGKEYNVYGHRLVALAYIANPENKPQVNHKDRDKLNNNVENLEWVSCQENINHSRSFGDRKGLKQGNILNAKLKIEEVVQIKRLLKQQIYSDIQIGYFFEVSKFAIYSIKVNKTWKHI